MGIRYQKIEAIIADDPSDRRSCRCEKRRAVAARATSAPLCAAS